jgi:hypothetical protein
MKIPLVVAALAIIPMLAFAAERPDGLLGTDAVSLNYTYINDNYGYYDEDDYNCASYGIGLNKSVIDREKFGIDANLRYYYTRNLSNSDELCHELHSGEAGATFYMKGMISPFFSGSVYYQHVNVDYKTFDYTYSDEAWSIEAKAGAEIHFVPGFSGRVYVAEKHVCKDSEPENNTRYGFDVLYWFTSRVGLSIGETYTTFDHINRYGTLVTIYYQFQ